VQRDDGHLLPETAVGPLLDIDTHPGVPRMEYERLAGGRADEPSSVVRGWVDATQFPGTALTCNGTWGWGTCGSCAGWRRGAGGDAGGDGTA
jgi:hypothetical protein